MRPLTIDDLLPLSEYAGRRREFFESLARYLDRYRRVRIGPSLTLLFENRQTLWFRVQEVLRITRLTEENRLLEELELYNRLLPQRDQLQGALLFDDSAEGEVRSSWQDLQGKDLCLQVGDHESPAELITCRPEDRALGAAHWVQFHVAGDARQLLADFRWPAQFTVSCPHYHHASAPLSDEVRQSLLDDLSLSDRD
jgi:hypothetical protein